MTVTVLVENSAPPGLAGEHGLSFFIEYRGHRLLLDGGSTGLAAGNARSLGVDVGAVELAVLSHGHYDHGDGLPALLAGVDAPLYLRPQALLPHYHGDDPAGRYIGLSREAKAALEPKLRPVEEALQPLDGVWLIPDSRVEHQQSLVLETGEGLVIFNSCCHGGAGFIVRDVLERFPGKRAAALVGGLHLMGAAGPGSLGVSPGIVKNLGKWLFEELGVGRLYTGHCTGAPALALLRESWPGRVETLTTGLTLTFDEG